MPKKSPGKKTALTIYLPEDVAKRLKLAAERQKRAASDVATQLLDAYLPRLEAGEKKKKANIPYS